MAGGKEDKGTWHVHWRDGGFTAPDGSLCQRVWADSPDIAMAHAAVDDWAARVSVLDALPRAGDWSPWWSLRFHIVHILLFELMPWLRTLQFLAASGSPPFTRIALHRPPEAWWLGLFGAAFPKADVEIVERASGFAAKWKRGRRVASRFARAVATERRLKRVPPPNPTKPRVMLVNQGRYWNGTRDICLGSVADALEEAGYDVVTWVQSHCDFAMGLHALRTRPKTDLFGDVVYWRFFRRSGWKPPGLFKLPEAECIVDGADLGPLIREYILCASWEALREHAIQAQNLPEILAQLGVRAVVTVDENGGECFLTAACAEAGIPVVGVQHGCIHPDHLHYMYPPGADPKSIPLSDITCVFGEHYRQLLCKRSIYHEDRVVVTGQPEADGRASPIGAWGARSPEGEQFRGGILPDSCDRLLLFTSQDLLHTLLREKLLAAMAASAQRNYLVVRPHPRELDTTAWERGIARFGLEGRACVRQGDPLDLALDACDVHLSGSSTVLSEAVLYGRPNIVVGAATVGDWLACLQGGVATDLDNFDTLDTALAHWLDATHEQQQEFEHHRQEYIHRHFHGLDGGAGKRVAQEVSELLAGA